MLRNLRLYVGISLFWLPLSLLTDGLNTLILPNRLVVLVPEVRLGTPTEPGQVIPGQVRCTGAILSCNRDGSDLQVVAWGLRNPYGLAFHPDGQLFATEHGMDERSRRYIVDDPDNFYEIRLAPSALPRARRDPPADRHWSLVAHPPHRRPNA